jgi:hypothetical protein
MHSSIQRSFADSCAGLAILGGGTAHSGEVATPGLCPGDKPAAHPRRYVRPYRACADSRTKLGAWHEQIFEAIPHGATCPHPKAFDLD